MQPDVVNLDISNIVFGSNIKSFKYERFTPSGCKKYRNKKNWVCIKNSVYFLISILIDIERWFDIYQSDKFSIDKSENTAHDDFSIVLSFTMSYLVHSYIFEIGNKYLPLKLFI